MNRSILIPALLATLSLVACDQPTVVNVPATTVAVPGPAGPAGATGSQGETGYQGNQGETGSQGETGYQGAEGSQGATGKTGESGDATTVIVVPAAPASKQTDSTHHQFKESLMLGTILLIVLILMLIGAIPTWPHSKAGAMDPVAGWFDRDYSHRAAVAGTLVTGCSVQLPGG